MLFPLKIPTPLLENLQIIWWALPDKVTVIEGNSVHRPILHRITPQHCNP